MIAGKDSHWRISLQPPKTGGPYAIEIIGENTIVLDNLLCGEVWICLCQSNMEMGLRLVSNAAVEIQQANYPEIRLFDVRKAESDTALTDIKGQWKICSPESVSEGDWEGFSAVAYFFGRRIHKKLNVPIGLIDISWSATHIELWIAPEGYHAVAKVSELYDNRFQTNAGGICGEPYRYARLIGNAREACREFDVPKSSFYRWEKSFDTEGVSGLKRKKPIAHNHLRKLSQEIVNKILDLRKTYHPGSKRIKWYLERYHGISVSESSVTRTLVRNRVNRLPKTASRRTVHTKRYAKKVPGHQVQVDVKFASLKDPKGHTVRRFQYTAIDDATRIRVLKIYQHHNQQSAINFIDYFIEKFPFRIHTVRIDRGHEFQVKFHWHVEDKGIRHVYIKPRTPQLNGKVERSHRTDQEEFYQLLTYTDDVDLNRKLKS